MLKPRELYTLLLLLCSLLWIHCEELSSAEGVISNKSVSVQKNFTYRSKDNNLELNVVQLSKSTNDPIRESKGSPDFEVRAFSNASSIKAGNSSSYMQLLQYNVTVFSPAESSLQKDNDSQGINDSSRTPKDEDVPSKIRYYLKYLDSLSNTMRLTTTPSDRCRSSTDCAKKQQTRLFFLDKMLDDYDKRAWPTYGTDKPTMVKVNIHINTLGPVNAAQMEYSMDIYLRQIWTDQRLQLSRFGVQKTMTLNAEDVVPHIWKPDIFFLNVKQASFHKVTVPNKLIKISPEGEVLYSMRITMRLACHMSFKHYPLDSQRCQIVLGSYAQTMDQVVINWRENNPIIIEQALELPEFDVAGMTYSNFTRSVDTGEFSFLNVSFKFVRQNGFHLIQTYMPTFLIVMISWVSFWLNVDATPARVTLGVTTLLTLTTVAYGVRMQLPPVSYIKAIDVWIGACSVMVFGALLEFTLVNYLSRSKLNAQLLKDSFNIFQWSKKLNMASEMDGVAQAEEEIAKNMKRARYLDRFCRIMFPFAFFIFNIAYWLYYLYVPDTTTV